MNQLAVLALHNKGKSLLAWFFVTLLTDWFCIRPASRVRFCLPLLRFYPEGASSLYCHHCPCPELFILCLRTDYQRIKREVYFNPFQQHFPTVSWQLIQTVSAVDKDDPPRGHKFFFELVPEYTIHPNFSIVDNKGRPGTLILSQSFPFKLLKVILHFSHSSGPDNTAGVITRRNGYSRNKMNTYLLPVVIFDNDYPIQSSTGTLTVKVCTCDSRGNMQSCNAEALLLPAGLSTGALIAILLCIIILLGK